MVLDARKENCAKYKIKWKYQFKGDLTSRIFKITRHAFYSLNQAILIIIWKVAIH